MNTRARILGRIYRLPLRIAERWVLLAVLAALAMALLPPITGTYAVLEFLPALLGREVQPGDRYAPGARARPPAGLQTPVPGTRLAIQFDPTEGSWVHGYTRDGVFLSHGRSIILHGGLRRALAGRGLIESGFHGLTYYISATDPDKLSLLGIKRRIERTAGDDWEQDRFRTYKNPVDVNVAYLDLWGRDTLSPSAVAYAERVYDLDGTMVAFLRDQDIVVAGNDIRVTLPALNASCDLVLTFVNWPGWQVRVDGKPVRPESTEERFLRVPVRPGQQRVECSFRPFAPAFVLLCPCFSIGAALCIALYCRRTASGGG